MSGDDRFPAHGTSAALFVGGGEMTTRMRAMDWAGTPVGPIQGWPQSLCIAVGIMLESRHPMLIWWGPEFTMFYNDAFMALAGSKHPVGLGQPGRKIFAEIWPTIGPILNGVLSSGVATDVDDQLLMMNRRSLEEETYWAYSFSPIRDIDGRVGGVFTVTTDTTAQVLGERQLRELGEIVADVSAPASSPGPAAGRVLVADENAAAWWSTLMSALQDGIFVADPDGTIVEVNDAFADILGYGAKDLPCVPPYPWWPDPAHEPEEFAQVQAAFTAATQPGGDSRWVLPMRRGADRRRVWVSITQGTVTHPDGSTQALVGTVRDVTAEHRTAHRDAAVALKRAILEPTVLPAGFGVRYEPAASHLAVGGDWYDIVELAGDHVGVAVGDCVGHGLGAAAVMGQLRTACRTLQLQNNTASQVLNMMDQVAALIPDACGTTLLCATIERATGTMRYSRAGHPPAILARADGRTELLDGARSLPLATVAVARPEATTVLAPGDTVLLYTHGLVERGHVPLDAGIRRARDLLAKNHHLAPDAIAERLAEQLLSDGHDDVAYLLYQHPLSAGATVTTTVAAHLEQLSPLRRTLRQWLAAAGVEQNTVHELVLAVGEAASNAVEHAYLDRDPGSIELTLSHHAEELHLEVRDQGRWRTSPAPGQRGRGLKMIERLTDAVTIDTDGHGTIIRLRKRLPD